MHEGLLLGESTLRGVAGHRSSDTDEKAGIGPGLFGQGLRKLHELRTHRKASGPLDRFLEVAVRFDNVTLLGIQAALSAI